jgi:signal transduction histidine kinase
MTIAPHISNFEAATIVFIALIGFTLAFFLFRSRKDSRYPNQLAALICFSIGAWLIVNAIDDRTSSAIIFTWMSRVSHAFGLLILLTFVRFASIFPPRQASLRHKILLIIAGAGSAFFLFLLLHPNDLVLYMDFARPVSLGIKPLAYYSLVAWYLTLLGMTIFILWRKWSDMARADKRVIRIITGGFLATASMVIAADFAVSISATERYLFMYAYYATLVFLCSFTYAILKYGALKSAVVIPRRFLSVSVGILIGLFALYLISHVNQLEGLALTRRALGTVVISLTTFLVFDGFLSARQTKQWFATNVTTVSPSIFCEDLTERYGLTSAVWKLPRTNRSSSEKSGVDLVMAANTVDLPKHVVPQLRARTMYDASPDRIALIIPTAQGALYIYRKKYNLAFTMDDVRALKHEANLFAANLEVQSIRSARTNHISQLEQLTESRRSKLERANATLYENLTKRTRFFQTVANELRTPLTVLSGALQQQSLLLSATDGQALADNTQRLVDLTREFKAVGDASSTKDTEQIPWLPVTETAEICVRRLRALAQAKNISLTIRVTPSTCSAQVRRLHFEQIIDNLVGNAIKYSPTDTRISLTVTVSAQKLIITVTDQGLGIAADDRELIFEPFFRGPNGRTVKGTGLGLSIVKRIAKSYGGNAHVEPNSPQGSHFVVELKVMTSATLLTSHP